MFEDKSECGRYETKMLYYYDGPQLWLRYEPSKREIRLFVNMTDEEDCAWSGVISFPHYVAMMKNLKTLKSVWEDLTDYRQHPYRLGAEDGGLPLSAGEAIGGKPLGDAYLEY